VKLKGLRSDPEFQPVLFICSIVSNSLKCGRPTPTRVLIYCSDYRCSHSVVMDGKRWSDDVGAICGPSKTWLKSKNPASAAVRREREKEWR
jgi:hypothetical protein